MNDTVIQVNNLGKRYRIGAAERYKTLRESIMSAAGAPFRWMRRRDRSGNASANTIWALKDVSFEVCRGEAVGIIGRNGAGKSTLLRVLSRITAPTSGVVDINGRVGSLLEVGTGFHPELTGRENIYLNGAILGMRRSEIERRFDEIVAFSEVERFLDTPVKRYSSGMYMRLAFSVAAHLEPEILIVDEVLAVGDAQFQAKCLGKMQTVAGTGRTVLFVSHNMAAISQICQRAVLLNQGRVEAIGPAVQIVERYWGGDGADGATITVGIERNQGDPRSLQLTQVRLLNAVGGSFSVRWKEPLSIAMTVIAHRPLKNVVFGLSVIGTQGALILTSHSTDEGRKPWDMEAGTHTIRLDIDNPLRSGSYVMEIGAELSLSKQALFIVADAVRFSVLDIASDGEPYPHHLAGFVNGHVSWSLGQSKEAPE